MSPTLLRPAPLRSRTTAALALAGLLLAGSAAAQPAGATPRPVLSVEVVRPAPQRVAATLAANGNIAAWQEASVGAETGGLRLAELLVDVGDRVRRGQPLARFATETVRAELAQVEAALAEAEAARAEAVDNAERTRRLRDTGALSAQQVQQALSAEQAATARVAAQRAALQAQQLRLAQAELRAPDDGVVIARSATLGAVASPGQELFRLIRGGRLEWRAELPSAELGKLRAGQRATLTTPAGRTVNGTLRRIAPTVDPVTRNALVHVDLAPGSDQAVRPGQFVRGEFALDSREALTLPASALLLREGRSVVMVVEAAAEAQAAPRVRQTAVTVLARVADRVAVDGLPAQARVVRQGAAFLADGDAVRVVTP